MSDCMYVIDVTQLTRMNVVDGNELTQNITPNKIKFLFIASHAHRKEGATQGAIAWERLRSIGAMSIFIHTLKTKREQHSNKGYIHSDL